MRRLEVSAGVAWLSLRDETASPLRYGARTPSLQVGYAVLRARSRFAVRAGTAFGSLTSSISDNGLPREADVHGWIEGEYLRTLGPGNGAWRWMAGGALAARVAGRKHYFANPARSGVGYGFASLALAPAGALELRTGADGILSARLAIPLLALVSRPYSDVLEIKYDGVPIRVVSVGRYRALDAGAAYARPVGSGIEVVIGYRLVVERFDDVQPYRSAHHALWLATTVRLGAGGAR